MMYPSKSYQQTEEESALYMLGMLVAFIALEVWLYGSYPVWFWIVTTFTIIVVIYEVWRVKKERREWQSRSAKVG